MKFILKKKGDLMNTCKKQFVHPYYFDFVKHWNEEDKIKASKVVFKIIMKYNNIEWNDKLQIALLAVLKHYRLKLENMTPISINFYIRNALSRELDKINNYKASISEAIDNYHSLISKKSIYENQDLMEAIKEEAFYIAENKNLPELYEKFCSVYILGNKFNYKTRGEYNKFEKYLNTIKKSFIC